jgi:NAD(P)-dependent dehydrogenase (short-subunit alcohol dehydrogenase family)
MTTVDGDAGESGPNVLIVGATSAVAQAVARRFVRRGWNLFLAGRDEAALEALAADLRVRGDATIVTGRFDASSVPPPETWELAAGAFPRGLDGVLVCHGSLLDERSGLLDGEEIRRTIDVNFTSVAVLLGEAAEYFAERRRGFIAAISSVAGDRGRQSNFCYGAAKAGLTAYMSGLRNRLHSRHVHVLTIKPGIIDSPMTRGLDIGPKPLVSTPDRIAADIERAIVRRRDTVYSPWFWRPIMGIITVIPEALFKRMRL